MAVASSPAPVGSGIFLSGSFLIICLLVLLLLRRFLTLRATPAYIVVPVFLALVLPASVVLLVPVDLASSSRAGGAPKGIWLPDRAVLVLWRITYWLIFVLTWVILPLLGDFVDSGYREPKDRFLYSLRSNVRYQLTVLACGVVGLIYISIQNGFDFTSIKTLVMALAYVWGLILAIYLMGHGLVSIPRSFLRKANNAGTLRRLQAHAPKVYDRLTDAITELEELEAQVAQLQKRKTGTAREFEDWIEELAEYSSLPESRPVALQSIINESSAAVPAVITERYMADLSRRLQRARHQKARFVDEWDRLVQSAADYQAIVNSSASKKLDFGRPASHAAFLSRVGFLTPTLRYHVYVHLLPGVRLILAAAFSAASACVVWSELIKTFAPRFSIISLSLIPRPDNAGQIGFGGQVVASLWLLYMCAAALKGVNDAKVWGNRALVRRNTYGESACWYAGQIARLTVPLSYNFLTFLPEDVRRDTTFYRFLGQYIDLTPLGKGFDYFFPIFVLLPVGATLFNLYGRIQKVFGFGLVEDDDDDAENNSGLRTGGWREGRELIERELSGLGSLRLTSRTHNPVRNGAPSAGNAARRAAPTIWVPPAERSSRVPRSGPASSQPVLDDEGEENFFQSFAHRVRNTIETASTPEWLEETLAGLRRPRWMAGDGNEPGDSGQAGGLFGRLFGGRLAGGQVRL
ncbi:hypothetical protein VTN77DRAFT_5802 [Rasamsonia byssochlamydoides]|uniref:uncharacterized protein n=1 Tax=Rasamsonia byssochlamydoides TaxID=89139 RepID=UPI003742F6A5